MSGMEFPLVIGIISGTATIIDSIVKICSEARKGTLSKTFRNTAQRLSLIRETLRVIEKRVTDDVSTDVSSGAIEEFVRDCKDKVDHLELACEKCIPEASASRLDRLLASTRAHAQSAKVVSLTKELLENVQLLVQRLAIHEPPRNQLQDIETAIETLQSQAWSTGLQHKAAGIHTRTVHYGYGSQNVHNNPGDQNIVLGTGAQYVGHTQVFIG
ncbi:hypothetical protein MMC10_011251 [Thelotrema lepadinum]|nr:hypothetical protein [Thelotrema lepadinum]